MIIYTNTVLMKEVQFDQLKKCSSIILMQSCTQHRSDLKKLNTSGVKNSTLYLFSKFCSLWLIHILQFTKLSSVYSFFDIRKLVNGGKVIIYNNGICVNELNINF